MENLELHPEIQPFTQGFLETGAIHSVSYSLYGNPQGEPVFFLHGGPGGGCDDDDARWFNPEKYLIVTHDQRGCGKSIPYCVLKDNNTQNLVSDIERLRLHLGIEKPISIFAGSWGSTLALLYAEKYPRNVKRMILRGIFTCTNDEQDYFYRADGAARFSPVKWNKLILVLPKQEGRITDIFHNLFEKSDDEGKRKWCRVLAEYEFSFFNVPDEDFENAMTEFNRVFAEMRLNMYYQANRFFLKDYEILDSISAIRNIPVKIIHGMCDLVCLPDAAYRLHTLLPHSEFHLIPEAGHTSKHPSMLQALLAALQEWEQ